MDRRRRRRRSEPNTRKETKKGAEGDEITGRDTKHVGISG